MYMLNGGGEMLNKICKRENLVGNKDCETYFPSIYVKKMNYE